MTGLTEKIIRPTLILDETRCRKNIMQMQARMEEQDVAFRPHFKTHQSKIIGNWFRDDGMHQITVSSVGMAHYFAGDGWDDITIAFPVNLRESRAIDDLAARVSLNLLAEDPEVIRLLDKELVSRAGVFLKIDTGTQRTGLNPFDVDRIDACVDALQKSSHLRWKGFLAHAGHTYHVRQSAAAIQAIYDEALPALQRLRDRYRATHPGIIISFGDTPGARLADFRGVDEMRPGNFVFYDVMQAGIGSCAMDDIAVAMYCPVVAVHPARMECVIYGGGIHFSKDSFVLNDGTITYGTVVAIQEAGWDTGTVYGYLRSLSQEHGVVRFTGAQMPAVRTGDLVCVLPVHSCMTAQCMTAYLDTQGHAIDHYASVMHT